LSGPRKVSEPRNTDPDHSVPGVGQTAGTIGDPSNFCRTAHVSAAAQEVYADVREAARSAAGQRKSDARG
jgi:hypothetical protein